MSAPPPAAPAACSSSNEPTAAVNWSRDQDNRLRELRLQLDKCGEFSDKATQEEYLALEAQNRDFEREGMRRLMTGTTPEDVHVQQTSASPIRSAGDSVVGFLQSSARALKSGASKAADYAHEKLPAAEGAVKAGWFWTSLIGTAAPGFVGRKLGLTDRYDHWNWIVPYTHNNRQGGLLLGAIPVMTEVMGSGNHLKQLHQEMSVLKTEMGMVVSCLLAEEMKGFGLEIVKFATHDDWKAEFGKDFITRLLPVDDCSANGFSFDLIMKTLRDVNEQMLIGKCVYVHCKAGKGRSWLFVICYMIVFHGMTVDQAIAHVKSMRHQVSPSSSQVEFARAFYVMHEHLKEHMAEERRQYELRAPSNSNKLVSEMEKQKQTSADGRSIAAAAPAAVASSSPPLSPEWTTPAAAPMPAGEAAAAAFNGGVDNNSSNSAADDNNQNININKNNNISSPPPVADLAPAPPAPPTRSSVSDPAMDELFAPRSSAPAPAPAPESTSATPAVPPTSSTADAVSPSSNNNDSQNSNSNAGGASVVDALFADVPSHAMPQSTQQQDNRHSSS